jgi:hypothetical protein
MPRQQREVNAFCDLFDKLVWFVTRFFAAARILAEPPEKRPGPAVSFSTYGGPGPSNIS